jgi:hypothetical protein
MPVFGRIPLQMLRIDHVHDIDVDLCIHRERNRPIRSKGMNVI